MSVQITEPLPGVRQVRDQEGYVVVFPQRPEFSACDFFLKTGHCKFGETCRFHHPLHAAVKLTGEGGYPLRPGMPVCPFYDRTGGLTAVSPPLLLPLQAAATCVSMQPCKLHKLIWW